MPVSLFTLPVDVTLGARPLGPRAPERRGEPRERPGQRGRPPGRLLSSQAQLAEDYFQLRALDAQSQILNETVEAYRKSLELTQNKYKSGVASRGDVLQAETQLKTTQAQAIDVGVQRAQLEHAIALLIGKPPSNFSLPALALDTLPPAIPVGVPSVLLERRPDIAGAERRMASANAQIGVAMAAYYPSVTLTGEAGFQSRRSVEVAHVAGQVLGLWPLGFRACVRGGAEEGADRSRRGRPMTRTVASYRQTVLTGFQEVEDNLAALRILEQEAEVQAEAVKLAEQSLAVVTNQYKAGTVAYLNVIVAQTIVLSNRITAINILGRRMTAAALLVKALGGGWDMAQLPAG